MAVFLSIGAWRLSRYQILVRKLSAVENLGAATTLCVDKTGTLTMNRMKIAKIFSAGDKRLIDFPHNKEAVALFSKEETWRLIIKAGALASARETFDPLEGAIKEARRQIFHENIYQDRELIREYPLSSGFLAMTNIWRQGEETSAYVKGTPEIIRSLSDLSDQDAAEIQKIVEKMAREGLRVLGVAYSEKAEAVSDIKQLKFRFLGLIGFRDPVRAGVAAAIKECYQAGIKVKMITGDYSETAKSIARQVGLENYEEVANGRDFLDLNKEDLKRKIKQGNIFARMMPEYKLRIIDVLKEDGEVVAMTGDGVNDGPALKAADIGVAMGAHGTDVARESADIVLLDDNFASLVSGVKEGRRIFDNLQRAVVYLVAVHIPIAALSLLPIILGWPLLFFPVHIMFLELIVDPVCSIVFEAESGSHDLMKRPPRNSKKSILNRSNLLISLIQGASILLFVFLVYYFGINFGWEEETVRAVTFATLISANIFLILVNRSWSENLFKSLFKKNQFLWPIVAFTVIFLLFSIYNPFLRGIFSFSALSLDKWTWLLVFSLFPALIFDLIKAFNKPRLSTKGQIF
ncbi:MAG: cation-translocating P-type ATPase [Patescibacteria group bacterium]